jgi:outer membrane protein
MFKRTTFLLSLTLASLAYADVKIGYVDLQRALLEVNEGRDAKKRLQAALDAKQKDLNKEEEALRKEKDVLDKQAAMMSEETRVQKLTEFQTKVMTLAQKLEKGKAEMAEKERAELQVIFKKMEGTIQQIAERAGLTMVVDKHAVVFAPPALDLTNELVRLYNDKNKATGGAGAQKAAPKADAPKPESKK